MARGRERGRDFLSAQQVEPSFAHPTVSSLTRDLKNLKSHSIQEQPWELTETVRRFMWICG